MDFDALLLSRIQFAFVIAFHFLLPAFTIGLASYIAVLEGLHLWTKKPVYLHVSSYWIKIFAVSFGMGVVSGIVMPFQFGTNWSRYSDITANIVAPLMGYEGLTAFFLEAAFLGVLLFGRARVPPWVHFFRGADGRGGTLFSNFWILALNSWMQTTGYSIADGRFLPEDWFAVIFNPSFPYRLTHTAVAFLSPPRWSSPASPPITRAGRFREEGRHAQDGLRPADLLVPLQMLLGDCTAQHARASTGEARGDGSQLGNAKPCRCCCCVAGRARRSESI
jgi:cytochrome d ubiquinol oxidase subunit I